SASITEKAIGIRDEGGRPSLSAPFLSLRHTLALSTTRGGTLACWPGSRPAESLALPRTRVVSYHGGAAGAQSRPSWGTSGMRGGWRGRSGSGLLVVIAGMAVGLGGCRTGSSPGPPTQPFRGLTITVAAVGDPAILATVAAQRGEWAASRGASVVIRPDRA